jgi:hypothetical protein
VNAPLPIQPAFSEQLNLTRVRAKLEPWLVAFYDHRLSGQFPDFTAEYLTAWVRKSVPDTAPDSAMRVLRSLRRQGKVNYECIAPALSRYRFLPLGEPVARHSPSADTIASLREEVARLRELLESAGVVDPEETP